MALTPAQLVATQAAARARIAQLAPGLKPGMRISAGHFRRLRALMPGLRPGQVMTPGLWRAAHNAAMSARGGIVTHMVQRPMRRGPMVVHRAVRGDELDEEEYSDMDSSFDKYAEIVGFDFGEIFHSVVHEIKKVANVVGPVIATVYPPAAPAIGGAMLLLNAVDKGDAQAVAQVAATQAAAASGNTNAQLAMQVIDIAKVVRDKANTPQGQAILAAAKAAAVVGASGGEPVPQDVVDAFNKLRAIAKQAIVNGLDADTVAAFNKLRRMQGKSQVVIGEEICDAVIGSIFSNIKKKLKKINIKKALKDVGKTASGALKSLKKLNLAKALGIAKSSPHARSQAAVAISTIQAIKKGGKAGQQVAVNVRWLKKGADKGDKNALAAYNMLKAANAKLKPSQRIVISGWRVGNPGMDDYDLLVGDDEVSSRGTYIGNPGMDDYDLLVGDDEITARGTSIGNPGMDDYDLLVGEDELSHARKLICGDPSDNEIPDREPYMPSQSLVDLLDKYEPPSTQGWGSQSVVVGFEIGDVFGAVIRFFGDVWNDPLKYIVPVVGPLIRDMAEGKPTDLVEAFLPGVKSTLGIPPMAGSGEAKHQGVDESGGGDQGGDQGADQGDQGDKGGDQGGDEGDQGGDGGDQGAGPTPSGKRVRRVKRKGGGTYQPSADEGGGDEGYDAGAQYEQEAARADAAAQAYDEGAAAAREEQGEAEGAALSDEDSGDVEGYDDGEGIYGGYDDGEGIYGSEGGDDGLMPGASEQLQDVEANLGEGDYDLE